MHARSRSFVRLTTSFGSDWERATIEIFGDEVSGRETSICR